MRYHEYLYSVYSWIGRYDLLHHGRLFKMAVQQGRSKVRDAKNGRPRLRREASELVSAQYLKAKRTHLYPAHLSEQAFTGLYVEALSEARTQLAVIFQQPEHRGRPVSTGILRSLSHVELSGTRKSPRKMQLPIKNWHSQPNLG